MTNYFGWMYIFLIPHKYSTLSLFSKVLDVVDAVTPSYFLPAFGQCKGKKNKPPLGGLGRIKPYIMQLYSLRHLNMDPGI